MTCPTCTGEGVLYSAGTKRRKACPPCGGTGRVPDDPLTKFSRVWPEHLRVAPAVAKAAANGDLP